MPTHDEDELWELLGQYLREPIPESVRRVFAETGLVSAYQNPRQRENALARMKDLSLSLRRHGLWGAATDMIREPSPESPAGQKDERWDLWNDLRRCAGARDDWAPLTLSRVFDESAGAALPSERVEISFDSRMPCSVLVGRIRALWPRLVNDHWVHATRRPKSRAVAYIRHVCLDTPPDTPWRQLMASWNNRYPQWSHRDVRAFRSAFGRAEQQLTGEAYGLEWFYSTAARDSNLRWRLFSQEELYNENTELRWAERHLHHQPGQKEQSMAWLLKMAKHQRRAQELAKQGLGFAEISRLMAEESADWKASASRQSGADLVEALLSREGQFPDPELGRWKVER